MSQHSRDTVSQLRRKIVIYALAYTLAALVTISVINIVPLIRGLRLADEDHLLLSKPILDELLGVLARKFSREREELARVAVWLGELAEWVRPDRLLSMAAEDADNRILECALAGRARAIVTGDKALLQLGNVEGIRIVTLRNCVSRLGQ